MTNNHAMFIRDAYRTGQAANHLWTKEWREFCHAEARKEFMANDVEYIHTFAHALVAAGLGSEAGLAASYANMLFAFDKGETLQFDAWRKSCEQIEALVLRGSTMSLDACMTTCWYDEKTVHEVRRQIAALYEARPARVVPTKTVNDALYSVNKAVVGLNLDQMMANKAMSLVQIDAIMGTLAAFKAVLSPVPSTPDMAEVSA